jgi:hypothetical protein
VFFCFFGVGLGFVGVVLCGMLFFLSFYSIRFIDLHNTKREKAKLLVKSHKEQQHRNMKRPNEAQEMRTSGVEWSVSAARYNDGYEGECREEVIMEIGIVVRLRTFCIDAARGGFFNCSAMGYSVGEKKKRWLGF